MSHSDKAINDKLKVLGDAYRLGDISREEYRARRRQVLMGLGNDAAALSDDDTRTTREFNVDQFQ